MNKTITIDVEAAELLLTLLDNSIDALIHVGGELAAEYKRVDEMVGRLDPQWRQKAATVSELIALIQGARNDSILGHVRMQIAQARTTVGSTDTVM